MVTVCGGTPAPGLRVHGRDRELAQLTRLLCDTAAGRGGALVLRGMPGTGRTTLLRRAAEHAERDGFLVLWAAGTTSEADLPLAGLHQLLLPSRELLPSLEPGRQAPLRRVLGLSRDPCDPLELRAAVHALLLAAAARRPTLCCVDDAHELDSESLAALVFAARRVRDRPLAMAFAADHGAATGDRLAELPSLPVGALPPEAALLLLHDRLGDRASPDLTDSLLDLAGGNPLALTELADGVTAEQLSGQSAPPDALAAGSTLSERVRRRLAELPARARTLVLLATADERLDRRTVADAGLDEDGSGLRDAIVAGLLTVEGDAIRRCPDVPAASLRAAAEPGEFRAAHRLLADTARLRGHAYRRVWHRAALAAAPSPALARELDRVAEDARRVGGHRDAAAASERAAALSADEVTSARRLVRAAKDHWAAGRPDRARTVLRRAAPLADAGLAGTAGLLAGEIELRRGDPAVAANELIGTARRLAGTHRAIAATTLMLAGEANCLAGDNERYCAIARDAAGLRTADDTAGHTALVVEHFAAMAATFSGRHTEAATPLRRVVRLGHEAGDPAAKTLASQAAFTLGDAAEASDLAAQAIACARQRAELSHVPWALVYRSLSALLTGRHAAAAGSSLEGLALAKSLGQPNSEVSHLTVLALLAALQGDLATAKLRLRAATDGFLRRGLGRPGALAAWAAACADLADDRPADAFNRLRRMSLGRSMRYSPIRVMAVPHFVEAAVRCGRRDSAERALAGFERWASTTGGAARMALVHRCHALLTEDEGRARERFAEAVTLHTQAGSAYDLAYTELLFARRLRRDRRQRRAREVLREAEQLFGELDARHWVRQVQRELRASGHQVRDDTARGPGELTPQQEQIATLVADGATNREIAARLFISHRTVDHHLRNIFTRLGIRSRVELAKLYR
ncbi:DNA-binding CsgD family transcriptional regulator [Saccharomonospora amisosensis]|uniref:DNA-binding CsgD family transcriptional regulator n=1 Tax=Saccharomonospora amisosensis TaxID=1128677 RepID=A0A7X5ZPY4_9PSEU|nr:LuxR family transcriptional regulator [Saccharomonospora amisosensis]NIJ11187.1 DNA-binding CsgD family transcriptional regulator [Saccharomonospora amisosensis]